VLAGRLGWECMSVAFGRGTSGGCVKHTEPKKKIQLTNSNPHKKCDLLIMLCMCCQCRHRHMQGTVLAA
jgi:hypothetical protein